MPLVGFEPTISAGECPQTYALDRPVTGTGHLYHGLQIFYDLFYDVFNISFFIYRNIMVTFKWQTGKGLEKACRK